jgi:hypothetical protein
MLTDPDTVGQAGNNMASPGDTMYSKSRGYSCRLSQFNENGDPVMENQKEKAELEDMRQCEEIY